MMRSLDQLSAADFESSIGTRFQLSGGGSRMSVELVEVSKMRHGNPDESKRAPFHFLLRADSGPAWPQGIYQLESEQHGTLELFVVPLRLDASGCYYCVTFS